MTTDNSTFLPARLTAETAAGAPARAFLRFHS
jgi:hypothetical protein